MKWFDPTLEGLAVFCEAKPATETYEWTNRRVCCIGQYCRSIGVDPDSLGSRYATLEGGCGVAAKYPHTFGAAAQRARAALKRIR